MVRIVIIGRRLPNEVVYRIKLYIKANKDIVTIVGAIGVSKKTIYRLQLNLNIWGEPYAPYSCTWAAKASTALLRIGDI